MSKCVQDESRGLSATRPIERRPMPQHTYTSHSTPTLRTQQRHIAALELAHDTRSRCHVRDFEIGLAGASDIIRCFVK
jgi:hypothetical protein